MIYRRCFIAQELTFVSQSTLDYTLLSELGQKSYGKTLAWAL
jgi:hypothetical protein